MDDTLDRPRCIDCGERGELAGHLDCPEPGRVSDRLADAGDDYASMRDSW